MAESDDILGEIREELGALKKLLLQRKPTDEAHTFETMQLKTAAKLYDLKESYLRTLCLRAVVKGQMVGGRWYVTPAEMDRVFKGVLSPLVKCELKPERMKNKVTLQAAAEEYGVDINVLRKHCTNRRFKTRQRQGRNWYVDRAELEMVLRCEGNGSAKTGMDK